MTNAPEPENGWMYWLVLISWILLVAWILSGCASLGPQPVETTPRIAPLALIEPCGAPRELPAGDFETVYNEYLTLISDYQVCRLRHAGLSDWARRLHDED